MTASQNLACPVLWGVDCTACESSEEANQAIDNYRNTVMTTEDTLECDAKELRPHCALCSGGMFHSNAQIKAANHFARIAIP